MADELKKTEQEIPVDEIDAMDPELRAVHDALAAEDSLLDTEASGKDGTSDGQTKVDLSALEATGRSAVEEQAAAGKSTMEVDGKTVTVSKGAARRFAMFDVDGDGLFSKTEVKAVQAQIKKNNQTVGLKDDSDGAFRDTDETGVRLDKFSDDVRKIAKKGDSYTHIQLGENGVDGEITVSTNDSDHNHYTGVLGDFDYDPKIWSVGYKTVYDSIGGESVSTELPILRYIGGKKNGNDIKIPNGVKSLDYTFEGNGSLESFPSIPNSVESMHATFKQCKNLSKPCSDFATGEVGAGFLWGNHWFNLFGWNKSTYKRVGLDGKTTLPDSVQDVSYCFEDCSSLQNAFTNTTSATKLENMDGYARNCGKLEQVLDVSEARMLPVSAQTDAYDGINTKMIKSIGGVAVKDVEADENGVLKFSDEYRGISMYANEGSIYASGKTETKPYSVDERDHLQYVRALQDYRANDRMYLADPSAVANATANMATTATFVDENGQVVHTTDPTKADEKSADAGSSSGGLLGGLFGGSGRGFLGGGAGEIVQRLGFGFLEYSLLKKVTKNPLVSLGITAGGQLLGVLPGTIGGVGKTLAVVGGLFGKDSAVGSMFGKIGGRLESVDNKLCGTSDKKSGPNVMTKEEAANMNVIKDASQALDAQNSMMSRQQLAKYNDNMAKRGEYSANYGTFQQMAEVQEGYGVFNNLRVAQEDSMSAFTVALLKKQQADGGELTDASKQELAVAAKQILQGWSTYGESAADGLRATYGGNPEEYAKGQAGLGKTMRACVVPNLELLQGLNNKYQFFTEQDIADVDSLSFQGLDGVTFSNYQPGMNYAPAEDPYVPKVDAKGKPKEGVFADYQPTIYDLDEFESKASKSHNREYRTENYVSTFDDGELFALARTAADFELGQDDISKKKPVAAKSTRDARVAQAEAVEAAVVQKPAEKSEKSATLT